MRLDGSRVEHFTWGQVNPFGMTFDPLGNFFTADCHSLPIYQLLRGGYYPSFGKPHDGLGLRGGVDFRPQASDLPLGLLQWGAHADGGGGQVAGGLVGHQPGDLADELSEFLGIGAFIAQAGQLVGDQRVRGDEGVLHGYVVR